MSEQIVLGIIVKGRHISFELPVLRSMLQYRLASMAGDEELKKIALEGASKVYLEHSSGFYGACDKFKDGMIGRLFDVDNLDEYNSDEERGEALLKVLNEYVIDWDNVSSTEIDDHQDSVELFYGEVPDGWNRDFHYFMKAKGVWGFEYP